MRHLSGIACAVALLLPGFDALAQYDIHDAVSKAAQAYQDAPQLEIKAAKPKYWTNSAGVDLGFSNISLTNWSAGGFNQVTLKAATDAKFNYKKNLTTWNNRLQMEYGFLYSADKPGLLQPSNDRIYLQSKLAFKTAEKSKWNYTASYDLKTQFSNGYTYNTPADGQTWKEAATVKSGFMSPGYTNIALGLEWIPGKLLDINFAPLTGGFTICTIEDLRKSYGMSLKPGYEEETDPKGYMYSKARFEFGAQIKADLKLTINEVFRFESQLVLFSDYLNKPQNLRVNWDNKITWQIARFFNISLNTWLIYDPLVLIDGVQKVQFKESLSLNFTYTIKTK